MRLDLGFAHAADMGIEVEWVDLGLKRMGDYDDRTRVIRLNPRQVRRQAAHTLAHELGHAVRGDRTSTAAGERLADEYGAAMLITVAEYAAAERHVGHHPNALALDLGVTPDLIRAWRRWYRKRWPSA